MAWWHGIAGWHVDFWWKLVMRTLLMITVLDVANQAFLKNISPCIYSIEGGEAWTWWG